MRIRIEKAPPGFPPEWVRKAWIGIVLPSSGREADSDIGKAFVRSGIENSGGYQVSGPDAMNELKTHNRKAFDWWKRNMPSLLVCGTLVFRADACAELPEV